MNAISPENQNSTEIREKSIEQYNFDGIQPAATDCNAKNDLGGDCQKTESGNSSKRSRGKKNKRKSGGKKHRRGRHHKKKLKSYYELTREEKEKVDKRNLRQRRRRRVKLRRSGMPLAPLNTTQFIVNDKKCVDIYEDSSRSGSEFTQDFNKVWFDVYLDYLQQQSEQELVNRYIKLEDNIDGIQREKAAKNFRKTFEESTKVNIFQEEIRKLKEKNDELTRINGDLFVLLESRGYVFEKRQNDENQNLQNVLSEDS